MKKLNKLQENAKRQFNELRNKIDKHLINKINEHLTKEILTLKKNQKIKKYSKNYPIHLGRITQ